MSHAAWDLALDSEHERQAVNARFGGRTPTRISPSKATPNVLLFLDPPEEEARGMVCGMHDDGCLHVTGEGYEGDQPLGQGNGSVLSHRGEGRAVRVFVATGKGLFRYAGEFEADPDEPFYVADAPERDSERIRTVVVFRLRPVGAAGTVPRTRLAPGGGDVLPVPVATAWTERAFVSPRHDGGRIADTADRLVRDYADHLFRLGHDGRRLRILPPGERKPTIAPLVDATDGVLLVSRGTTSRSAFRSAVGELLDLRRFADVPRMAVLLPGAPRRDLADLARALSIAVVWRERNGDWRSL